MARLHVDGIRVARVARSRVSELYLYIYMDTMARVDEIYIEGDISAQAAKF